MKMKLCLMYYEIVSIVYYITTYVLFWKIAAHFRYGK